MADGDGIGAERQRLGDVAAIADAAGIDERDLALLAELIDGAARLADRGNAGNAGILRRDMRAGTGAAFHGVDIDRIRIAFHRHAHIVIDARRAELELDRDFPIGRLADFLDLERQIVGPEPVRMTGGRALVDAGGQRAHLGDLVGHLLAHQMAAEADLAALADEELAGIGEAQMMRVEAVARLDALVEPFHRIAPLVGDHAAFARAGGGARHGGAAGERDLGLIRKRAEGHAGHIDRDIEHHRALGARADDRLGLAFLAIAFDDEAGQRARQEGEIVPMRDLLEQREAAHAVAAELRLDVDVVHHFGREDLGRAQDIFLALGGRARQRGKPGRGALRPRHCRSSWRAPRPRLRRLPSTGPSCGLLGALACAGFAFHRAGLLQP